MFRIILRWLLFLPVLIALYVLVPLSSSADQINLVTKFDFSLSSVKTTDVGTGDVTESDSRRFNQQYKVDLLKEIYPHLRFNAGGTFALESVTTSFEDIETERTAQTIRPYLELHLNSPLVGVNVGYHRSQKKEEIGALSVSQNFKDDWNFNFKYNPSELPQFRIFHIQTHTYDADDTLDSYNTSTTLLTRYTAFKKIPFKYTYGRTSTENRKTNYELLGLTHDARVSYSDSFFNRWLFMDTNYKIKHHTTSFPSGSQSAEFPLSPSQGIFSLDNTPQGGPALAVLTALIDGDVNASSGINIGWSQSLGDERNIGLDFGVPTNVDKIYISVDRNVTSSVSNTFSWAVYTSPDNADTSTWTLHATVIPAGFGVFQNRFTISFPEVTARYIKVVVSPLSSAFIVNSTLENIFVTEMQAFATITSNTETDLISVEHNYGLNLHAKVSEDTSVGYNFFYTLKDTDPATERTTFSNNVYTRHAFNEIFSASLRVGMDKGELTVNSLISETAANTYTAMVKADYLETFQQTLSVSRRTRTENNAESSTNSVFLHNNVKLYSGFDAVLDAGYNQNTSQSNIETSSAIVRIGSSIVPNEKLSISLHYTGTKHSGATSLNQTYNIRTSYHPYKALSLFAGINVEDKDSQDDLRILQNYSVNWSPFPDGDLQLFLAYNETLRSADERRERTTGPGLKWKISRRASLDMAFFYASVESALTTTDSFNFSTHLQVRFY